MTPSVLLVISLKSADSHPTGSMRASKLPDEAMPTLYLTRDEQLSVEKEADDMLRDSLDAFEAFVASGRSFPTRQWKRVKSKEGVEVYRTRQSCGVSLSATSLSHSSTASYPPHQHRASHLSSSSSQSSSSGRHRSPLERSNSSDIAGSFAVPLVHSRTMAGMQQFPVVVLTGIAPGTVEDVALGGIASTEAMWRLRSMYVNDRHRDCRILATLTRPTKQDPFNFMGVKWAYRKLPAFVQQRDAVYVESVGVTRDAEGKIDMLYNLMHSIELPGVPELLQYDILRIKLSLCYIMRQHDETSVEFFCRGFLLPSGDMPTGVAAMIYADGLLSTINLIDCAHMKKLMWLTQQRRRQHKAKYSSLHSHRATVETATHCQSCERGLKIFGGLSTRVVSKCRCCRRIVCTKCSSERKIVLDVAEDGRVLQKPLAFCVQCVMEARKLSALEIATATAGNEYQDW